MSILFPAKSGQPVKNGSIVVSYNGRDTISSNYENIEKQIDEILSKYDKLFKNRLNDTRYYAGTFNSFDYSQSSPSNPGVAKSDCIYLANIEYIPCDYYWTLIPYSSPQNMMTVSSTTQFLDVGSNLATWAGYYCDYGVECPENECSFYDGYDDFKYSIELSGTFRKSSCQTDISHHFRSEQCSNNCPPSIIDTTPGSPGGSGYYMFYGVECPFPTCEYFEENEINTISSPCSITGPYNKEACASLAVGSCGKTISDGIYIVRGLGERSINNPSNIAIDMQSIYPFMVVIFEGTIIAKITDIFRIQYAGCYCPRNETDCNTSPTPTFTTIIHTLARDLFGFNLTLEEVFTIENICDRSIQSLYYDLCWGDSFNGCYYSNNRFSINGVELCANTWTNPCCRDTYNKCVECLQNS